MDWQTYREHEGVVDYPFGEINYYLTYFLTGHGYFHNYLFKMGKARSLACPYSDSDLDNIHHTFFECDKSVVEKQTFEVEVGQIIPNNVMKVMLSYIIK